MKRKWVLLSMMLVLLGAVSQIVLAQDKPAAPKRPPPRFITVRSVDQAKGEVIFDVQVVAQMFDDQPTLLVYPDDHKRLTLETKPTHVYFGDEFKVSSNKATWRGVDGKEVGAEAAAKRLKPGVIVLLSADGAPVDGVYLRMFKEDALVLVLPVEELPVPYSPHVGGSITEKKIGDLEKQWYLFAPGSRSGRPGSINAIKAWEYVRPAKPVVVALLDGGVNWTHPDLAANIWTNPGESGHDDKGRDKAFNGVDDDGNGYVDDVHGWDFASHDNNPNPEPFDRSIDHGSMMAGLMAGVPNKGKGFAGLGRNLKIMPLRVAGDYKANLSQTLPAAIRYAVRNGARVIVTGVYIDDYVREHKEFREALKESERKGVLVVLAPRMNGGSLDNELGPLAKSSNVVIVGATRKDGSLAWLPSPCRVIKIAAPGEDMRSCCWGDYGHWPDVTTCPAAALVAAAAATLISQEPGLTPPQVIERLQKTSRKHPSLDRKISGGLLDMEALMASVGRK
jgi:subtilisin family serine protease